MDSINMARPPKTKDGALEAAAAAVGSATDVEQLRAAQALLLPLLGLTLDQTAMALGKNRFWVSRARNRLLRGEPAVRSRGGRRKALLTREEEVDMLLAVIVRRAGKMWNQESFHDAVRDELKNLKGAWVYDSTINDIAHRVASQLFPGATGEDLKKLEFHLGRLLSHADHFRRLMQHRRHMNY